MLAVDLAIPRTENGSVSAISELLLSDIEKESKYETAEMPALTAP
jgi:hypothetical protein